MAVFWSLLPLRGSTLGVFGLRAGGDPLHFPHTLRDVKADASCTPATEPGSRLHCPRKLFLRCQCEKPVPRDGRAIFTEKQQELTAQGQEPADRLRGHPSPGTEGNLAISRCGKFLCKEQVLFLQQGNDANEKRWPQPRSSKPCCLGGPVRGRGCPWDRAGWSRRLCFLRLGGAGCSDCLMSGGLYFPWPPQPERRDGAGTMSRHGTVTRTPMSSGGALGM